MEWLGVEIVSKGNVDELQIAYFEPLEEDSSTVKFGNKIESTVICVDTAVHDKSKEKMTRLAEAVGMLCDYVQATDDFETMHKIAAAFSEARNRLESARPL